MDGLSVCHVRCAWIGDGSRSLISEVRVCLELWVHRNSTWRYRDWDWDWDWKRIWQGWPNDNRRLHSSPRVQHTHSLLILGIQIINLKLQWNFLISELILFLSQLQAPWQALFRYLNISVSCGWPACLYTYYKFTSRASSESEVYSALSLFTWDVKSFSIWIASLRIVALSFLGRSGSVYLNTLMAIWYQLMRTL
jgi:hypothetical protein